jgi:Xaa-Pro aminopeptidase
MADDIKGFDLTPPEEIRARVSALQRKMGEKGIDLALILQNADLFYFTGTLQRGYLCIPQDGEPVFFVQKYYDRAVRESPLPCIKVKGMKALPNLLRDHGITGKQLGLELDVIPVSLFYRIGDLFGNWEALDISSEIKEIRSIKSAFEIQQIKQSGKIIDRVFPSVMDHLREGMTELELDGILVSIGRTAGHQGLVRMRGFNQEMMNAYVLSGGSASIVSFGDTPLCGAGATHAIAQGSSSKKIKRDEPIVIDYGGGYNGYVTDETRTFVIGELKDHLERAFQVARSIIEDVESSTRPGDLATDIYARAKAIADKEGLDPYFMGHGEGQVAFVGHGIGLEVNEWPIIGRGFRRSLEPGMVFAFEPKFVFPGEGAVGIELDYIVREDGLERVTHFPVDIVSVKKKDDK